MEHVTVESDSREARQAISLTVIPVIRIGGRRAFRGSVRGRRYLDVTNEQLPGTISRSRERGRSRKSSACSRNFSNKISSRRCAAIQGVFQVSHAFPPIRTLEPFEVDFSINVKMIFYSDIYNVNFSFNRKKFFPFNQETMANFYI